jgi:hypothetical protein
MLVRVHALYGRNLRLLAGVVVLSLPLLAVIFVRVGSVYFCCGHTTKSRKLFSVVGEGPALETHPRVPGVSYQRGAVQVSTYLQNPLSPGSKFYFLSQQQPYVSSLALSVFELRD